MKKTREIAVIVLFIECALLSSCRTAPNDIYNRIGVCTSVEKAPIVQAAGGSYVEVGIAGFMKAEQGDDVWSENAAKAKACVLPITSGNGYYPGDICLVGPNAEPERAIRYAEVALRRAAETGLKTVVFGSSKARNIPEGFSREEATAQFTDICRRMAPIAEKYGITVVIEPLQKSETNFINTVLEGLDIVLAVNHPNLCVLADFFHMAREGESPESIVKAGKYLRHCHIAECENRTAPGVAGDDFRPYFRALKQIDYRGNISLECRWDDFSREVGPAIAEVKKQLHEVFDE